MPAPLVKIDLEFPYTRSVGPVIGAYLDGLEEGRLLASRAAERTLSPPLEYDPVTGASVEPELVEVGPEGVVTSWTWVEEPNPNHPLDRPFAFALIQLDGADTAMVHVVDGPRDAIATGVRVRPRWRDARTGYVTDIECFTVESAGVSASEPGVPARSERPIENLPRIMPFPVSLHYEAPAAPALTRYAEALVDGRIIGQQCTGDCGLIYVPPRDLCPIDVIELTTDDDVELGDHGTVVNFTVVTPVQYPGQEETEPFARVSIVLDGPGGMLQLQDVLDTPVSDVRVGLRVAAVWKPEPERNLDELASGGWSSTNGGIEGWMPTGEPDVDVSAQQGKGF